MKTTFVLRISFFLLITMVVTSFRFENATYDVFPLNSGTIAAFGHFDFDEYTDIFLLQQGGKRIQIIMAGENGEAFQPQINCSLDSLITSIVPGDFNGDSHVDVLVTLLGHDSKDQEQDVRILWGGDGYVDCKAKSLFKINNQPLVVDFNGDMIPDIIAEENNKKYVWIFSTDKSFTRKNLTSMGLFRNPHSSGLIDLDGDLAADILITGEQNIEKWINTGNGFIKNGTIPYPAYPKYFQSTFVDLDLDSKVDHILPVCCDDDCTKAAILVWNESASDWDILLDNFRHQNLTWSFKLPKGTIPDLAASLPVTLRAGDVDLDGYPDFIILLQSNGKVKPVIIQNIPCINADHCLSDRSLQIIWDVPGLDIIPNAEIVSFFDLYEDGILDVLVSTNDNNEWKMHALKNTELLDSCFMKVLVLSGLCNNCTLGKTPYGVNIPGPIVQYNITKLDGQPLVSSAVQISQTAYFSLHLPYSLFGLGQTPNFVDALTVAIPAKFDKTVHRREWTQIIPNSQIVVIPHPPSEEKRWIKRLFVTPSQNVILTCFALIGTCIFISIIVAILHLKERREDKKEKMQDAYRYLSF